MDPKEKLTAAQVAEQQPEAAAALRAEGESKGKADGIAAGAASERARIQAILENPEAADRAGLAQHFAFGTDMTAEAAIAALAKSPKVPVKPANPLAAAMAGEDNPQIGADTDTQGDSLDAAVKRSVELGNQFGIQ